jgi:hypothetical protein
MVRGTLNGTVVLEISGRGTACAISRSRKHSGGVPSPDPAVSCRPLSRRTRHILPSVSSANRTCASVKLELLANFPMISR